MGTAWCIVYSAVFPALVLLLWAIITRPSAHKLHVSFLGLAVSLMTTPFLTDIIKNAVGRPRPDLIDRCRPEAGTPEHKLVTFSVCMQVNEHILQEGWRSFPSGHSSFAFAGLGFLSLYTSYCSHKAIVLIGEDFWQVNCTSFARALISVVV